MAYLGNRLTNISANHLADDGEWIDEDGFCIPRAGPYSSLFRDYLLSASQWHGYIQYASRVSVLPSAKARRVMQSVGFALRLAL